VRAGDIPGGKTVFVHAFIAAVGTGPEPAVFPVFDGVDKVFPVFDGVDKVFADFVGGGFWVAVLAQNDLP